MDFRCSIFFRHATMFKCWLYVHTCSRQFNKKLKMKQKNRNRFNNKTVYNQQATKNNKTRKLSHSPGGFSIKNVCLTIKNIRNETENIQFLMD